MKLESVYYHVGNGEWKKLEWDKDKRLFVSDDGTIKVAKPKTEDGKETTVKAQWGESEYAVTCTPGYDPTICSIYDPSKGNGGRVEIRFGSTPPAVAAQPDAAPVAAAAPQPPPAERAAPSAPPARQVPTAAPSAPLSGDAPLSETDLRKKVTDWIIRDYPPNQRNKALAGIRKSFKNFSGQYSQAAAEARYETARKPASQETPVRSKKEERQAPPPAARPVPAASPPPATGLLTGQALGERVATWVHEHYKDDAKGPMFHLTQLRGRLSHGNKKGFYTVRTNPEALDAFLNAYLGSNPSVPKARLKLGDHKDLDLGAPRGSAKGAATVPAVDSSKADAARKVAEARAEKTRVAAETKAAALEKRKAALAEKTEKQADARRKADEAKQAAASEKVQAAAAKAAERDQKLFEEANTVLTRVTAISKMPSSEVAKITADELSALYRGIKDYSKGDKIYDAARSQLISLSKQKAQSIIDGLKQKQATVEMIAREGPDSARKLWRAMAEFRSLYQAANHDLKALEALEPQTASLKEIASINTAINRVRVADIKGEEAKMRSELAKVTSALERIRNQMPKSAADSEKMAVLYKVADEMAKATENLDAFRKSHKDQLPKDVALIDGQRSDLAERLKGLQTPLIAEIRKYPGKMPQVENFDDPSQYGWITDESPSPDGKVRELQVRYAKAMIGAAEKLLGPDPKKWDDAIIVDPDSRNVETWKKYWDTAQKAIQLVTEFNKTGKTPTLVPAGKPIDLRKPEEKVKDAAAAAKAAQEKIAHDRFDPIRKNLQSQIGWVNAVNMKLLDDYGRPNLPVPPVSQLEEFEARLKEIQTTLSKLEIDESGMSGDDIHAADDLRSNSVIALGVITKLLIYIAKAKTGPASAPGPQATTPAAQEAAPTRPAAEPARPAPTAAPERTGEAPKTREALENDLVEAGIGLARADNRSSAELRRDEIAQIAEEAQRRGFADLKEKGRRQLASANRKVVKFGGRATWPAGMEPSAPAKPAPAATPVAPPAVVAKPVPPAKPAAKVPPPRADVRAQRAEQAVVKKVHAQYVDVREKLKAAISDTIKLHNIFHDDKGNLKNIPLNADQIRAHREQVRSIDKRLEIDLDDTLRNTLTAVDKKEWDDLQPKRGSAQNSLTDIMGALNLIEGENAAKEKTASLPETSTGTAAEADAKTRLEEVARGAFKDRMRKVTEKRDELTSINEKLNKKPSLEQLAEFEKTIMDAKSTIEGLYKDPKDIEPNAQGFLNTCEIVLKRIVVLRTELEADKKYDAIRADVTAEMKKTDELKKLEGPKKVKLDISTLQANIEKLAAIKNKLEGINKDVPETEKTRSLKNLISSNIARIETYIAELGTAISQKKAEEEALRKIEERPAEKPAQAKAGRPTLPAQWKTAELAAQYLNAGAVKVRDYDAGTIVGADIKKLLTIRDELKVILNNAEEIRKAYASDPAMIASVKTLRTNAIIALLYAHRFLAPKVCEDTTTPTNRCEAALKEFQGEINALKNDPDIKSVPAEDITVPEEHVEQALRDIKGRNKSESFPSRLMSFQYACKDDPIKPPKLSPHDSESVLLEGLSSNIVETRVDNIIGRIKTGFPPVKGVVIEAKDSPSALATQIGLKLAAAGISPVKFVVNPYRADLTVDVTFSFSSDGAEKVTKKIQESVATQKAARAQSAKEAEEKRLEPLRNMSKLVSTDLHKDGLVMDSNGKTIEFSAPISDSKNVELYASRLRIKTAANVIDAVKRMRSQMKLDGNHPSLIIVSDPDLLAAIHAELKERNLSMSAEYALFSMEPRRDNTVYIISRSANDSRSIAGDIEKWGKTGFKDLFTGITRLEGRVSAIELEKDVKRGNKIKPKEESLGEINVVAKAEPPPPPAKTLKQMSLNNVTHEVNLRDTTAMVYRRKLPADEIESHKGDIADIMQYARSQGFSKVLVMYNCSDSIKKTGRAYSASESRFKQLEPALKGNQSAVIAASAAARGSDVVDYIFLKEGSKQQVEAVGKNYAAYLTKLGRKQEKDAERRSRDAP